MLGIENSKLTWLLAGAQILVIGKEREDSSPPQLPKSAHRIHDREQAILVSFSDIRKLDTWLNSSLRGK